MLDMLANDETQSRALVPVNGGYDDDGEEYQPVETSVRQYLDYVGTKQLEIDEQKQSRHYYHGAQYTADEIKVLQKRRQPIVTFNRINRKIDGIVGLVEKLRSDPKAFPRNPRNEGGAALATQCVRTVLDQNEWKTLDHNATERCAIEGVAGVEIKLADNKRGNPKIVLDYFFGEDWFYDPRSRKEDYSDGLYHGLAKWLDIDVVIETFPDKADQIRGLADSGFDMSTHSDQEYKWIYSSERKIRLVEHWYKWKGKWCWCFYVANVVLDEGVSPFLDEDGNTMSRFIAFSMAVDHDGDRYGFVRTLKSAQDEINQRRSKALHISNSRRIISEKGAVDDVETARREWARADGWLEINPGFSNKIKPDDQQADLANQLAFQQDAKGEIDSYANVNPALLAGGAPNDHSGVAIDLMQRAGLAELSKFVLAHRSWKLRVYRAIWNIAQQFWTEEDWIRVTDDEQVVNFIQLNGVGIDRNPQSPNFGRPTLVNAIGELDVDIIMDEGPDVVSVMQDAYEILKDDPGVPVEVKVEASPLPGGTKKRILGLLQQAKQTQKPDPAAALAASKVQTEQIKQQTTVIKGKAEIQKANVAAQAEVYNAHQDAVANQQQMALEQMDAQNKREELQQRQEFLREQHAFRMEELRMKRAALKQPQQQSAQ
jgi:hypothetical protein